MKNDTSPSLRRPAALRAHRPACKPRWRLSPLALAMACALAPVHRPATAQALPTGLAVVHGQATSSNSKVSVASVYACSSRSHFRTHFPAPTLLGGCHGIDGLAHPTPVG